MTEYKDYMITFECRELSGYEIYDIKDMFFKTKFMIENFKIFEIKEKRVY